MDHVKILKRALDISWRYKALWVFGIILALTTGRNGGSGNSGSSVDRSSFGDGQGEFPRFFDQFSPPNITPEMVPGLIAAGLGLVCLVFILTLVFIVARYVAETALIRMVDHYEETDQKVTIRQGFGWGWSRASWRLFLIDLLIGLPLALIFIALFMLALSPLLLWATENTAAGVMGTVVTVGVFFLLITLAIVIAATLSLLQQFFRRVCVLDDQGVIESIKQGFALVKQNLKDVGIMWLIMIGVGIGWVILLIPLMILLLALGVIVGGVPALLVAGLAGQMVEGTLPWVIGGAVGIPILIMVMAIPLLFVGGLYEVFRSSVWTLTYREVTVLGQLEVEPVEAEPADTELDEVGLDEAEISDLEG